MNHNILCVVYNWRILCMLPKILQHACGKPTCQALQQVSRSRPHQWKASALITVHVFVRSLSFWYITIIPNSHIIFHKRCIISCEIFVIDERWYFMPWCQQENILEYKHSLLTVCNFRKLWDLPNILMVVCILDNFCQPLGDQNVWGSLYPIKAPLNDSEVVVLAAKVMQSLQSVWRELTLSGTVYGCWNRPVTKHRFVIVSTLYNLNVKMSGYDCGKIFQRLLRKKVSTKLTNDNYILL